MSLQLTPELASTVEGILASGRYKSEEEVLKEALASLHHEEESLAAIMEGIEDEAAGRLIPWSEVKAQLRAKYETAG
jgi:putative addiction module CopG family antidote